MDTRRMFLAVVLSLAVLIVWNILFPPKPPQRPPAGPEPGTEISPPPERPVAPAPAAPEAAAGRAEAAAPAGPETRPPIEAAREERIVLEVGGVQAIFTNRGAQLVSLFDRGHRTAEGKPLDLVRARQELPYPYGLVGGGLEPHPLNDVLFVAARASDGRSVLFRYSGPYGAAEKRFAFDAQGLLETEVTVPEGPSWGLVLGPGIRNPTAEELESRFERRSAVYKSGEVQVLDAAGAHDAVELSGGALRWVGLEDTYFLAAAVPREGLGRVVLQPVLVQNAQSGAQRFAPVPSRDEIKDEQKDLPREYLLVLHPAGETLSLVSYWGAKEYDRLQELPHELEETVQLGVFWFLARPLLVGLRWIHDHMIANFGWAIILMTVLIKVLLLPLTHKSMVSMRKMQALNPKMQAIRERYRPKLRDKQGKPNLEMQRKMNEEVMALYKQEGVNPAGGCLPLLLQMPILFAFYNLLTAAVELRGAPWMLWIEDLSARDPYYVLPIVMGATQFLQVRMGPQVTDPMQRRMFQLMPIFMTFLFLGFPSGLVLYWLTNNVLTIVQQSVYNHLRSREGATAGRTSAGKAQRNQP